MRLPSYMKDHQAILSSIWILSLMLMTLLLVVASSLAYQSRWGSLSTLWRVLEEKKELPSDATQVFIDAQNVFYIGADRQIVPLDQVIATVQEHFKRSATSEKPILFLRVAKGVESHTLLPLLSELEGVSLHIGLWEEE